MAWIPDGRRLRQVREQQEYTIEHLAEAAGVGEKTIRNLEAGRTRRARLPTLKALAAVLDIEVTDIAVPEEEGGARGPGLAGEEGPGAWAGERVPAGLPLPSRLELLVEQDLQQQRPPPVLIEGEEEGRGPIQLLTPKKFQDIMTAFLLHEGARFWFPGVVLRQRGISEAEARVLATECGIGARFLLSQRAELTGSQPFHVTVYSLQPAHTRLLQQLLESRAEVALLLRVVVARPEPAPEPAVSQGPLGPGQQRPFLGFSMYGSQTLHPWALALDDVLERGARRA